MRGKKEQARKSLQAYRGVKDVDAELRVSMSDRLLQLHSHLYRHRTIPNCRRAVIAGYLCVLDMSDPIGC